MSCDRARFAPGGPRPGAPGFALPAALLGLMLLSALTLGLLLASATESALSFAQRDATADLYAADGALQAYVAARNHELAPVAGVLYQAPGSATPVRITVERLAQSTAATGRVTSFAVSAEPAEGGRRVSAMVRVREESLANVDFGPIDAALTLGGDAKVAGAVPQGEQYKISNGADSDLCDPALAANHAVVHAAGTTVTDRADQRLGDRQQSASDREALIREVLGGVSMRDLAWNADLKFGAYFNRPAWETRGVRSGTRDPFDWSCPRDLIAKVRAARPNANQPCAPDAEFFSVIAIDGQNRDVVIDNWHGQGLLVVINGTLRIQGGFVFKGLILAERNVVFSGGGSADPTVEGAVISAGELIVDDEQAAGAGPTQATGKAQIRFNRCALNAVQAAFNGDGQQHWGAPDVLGRTFAWSELVR